MPEREAEPDGGVVLPQRRRVPAAVHGEPVRDVRRRQLAVELDEQAQAAPIAALARSLYPSAEVSVFRDAGGYERVVRISLPRGP